MRVNKDHAQLSIRVDGACGLISIPLKFMYQYFFTQKYLDFFNSYPYE